MFQHAGQYVLFARYEDLRLWSRINARWRLAAHVSSELMKQTPPHMLDFDKFGTLELDPTRPCAYVGFTQFNDLA